MLQKNRRTFIKQSAAATTALLLHSLDELAAKPPPILIMNKNFTLLILATNWGFTGSLDEYCAKVKKEGYDGIEIWWPLEKTGQDDLFATLKKYELQVGFLCGASEKNAKEHLARFQKMADAAATNTIQKPLYINCHSGRDYFSYEENKAFIDHTTQLSKKPVY